MYLFFRAFGQNPSDARRDFGMRFAVDHIAECGAAVTGQFHTPPVTLRNIGQQPQQIEIDPSPSGDFAGIALGQMHFAGIDDHRVPRAERKHFSADQKNSAAVVTVTEFQLIVNMRLDLRFLPPHVVPRLADRKNRVQLDMFQFPGFQRKIVLGSITHSFLTDSRKMNPF
ncbi:MAG: hypothetical protein PHU71_07015 [Candidatus Gracilibacteria bacterium]|nr:hypothetical protein [Candidatus Gracilibacteria bacterium]